MRDRPGGVGAAAAGAPAAGAAAAGAPTAGAPWTSWNKPNHTHPRVYSVNTNIPNFGILRLTSPGVCRVSDDRRRGGPSIGPPNGPSGARHNGMPPHLPRCRRTIGRSYAASHRCADRASCSVRNGIGRVQLTGPLLRYTSAAPTRRGLGKARKLLPGVESRMRFGPARAGPDGRNGGAISGSDSDGPVRSTVSTEGAPSSSSRQSECVKQA